MQDVLDQLIAARALIADEGSWLQGMYGSPATARYCALGAVRQVMQMERGFANAEPYLVLQAVSEYYFGTDVAAVNDHGYLDPIQGLKEAGNKELCILPSNPYDNVLFIYDKAIAGVREVIADAELQVTVQEVDLVTL